MAAILSGGTILMSHFILYYFYVCIVSSGGALLGPVEFWKQLLNTPLLPTVRSTTLYVGFLLMQILLAMIMPGLVMEGLPLKGGYRLKYLCNGLASWYVTLAFHALLHFTGILPLHEVAKEFGPLMTSAVIVGNLVSLYVLLWPVLTKQNEPGTGISADEFFMGVWLNPRIGVVDIKMFAEIRVSWILLFLLTASNASEQYHAHGVVTSPMLIILLAHFLYTNACQKGEECIPTTWDIFHERFGWMLAFWNLAGVPFLYCIPSLYLRVMAPFEHPRGVSVLIAIVLMLAYYVWDTANSQKNRYRMMQAKTYVARNAFPQLPWGTLHAPREFKVEKGTFLLDGWWQYVRKPHYTADMVMALCWGLACGFGSFLPFFYFCFLSLFLMHRCKRDGERLAHKYGDTAWEGYCEKVPYILLPYVY
ncbi:uncharacterized protein LOC135820893 [Sycon ciliatum]|uniref:uncharacterized protein LOC135820893 n=1 Tax=Sycon ciliatum TaxID=27933 RepID=UPI0020A848F8|eukprot:scpid46194/ scgid31834/ Delta(24(24(1)))-sterol reductase; C-24(28) sterol reductase; Sterol Delta(24(28))-reductase